MSDKKNKSKAVGGFARAKKMTKEERSAAAKRAATARWNKDLPLAPFTGHLEMNGRKIPCAVLEDGRRLITTAGILTSLGRPWRGTYKEKDRTQTPNFLAAKNLEPFISEELRGVLTPVDYRTESGSIQQGYPASILRLVCNVYLKARREAKLIKSQTKIAVECELVLDALAEVGVTALIDEATGYQYFRANDALAQVLEMHLAKERQPWTKTFPDTFYREIYRLRRWPYTEEAIKRKPQVVALWTNNFVYDRLLPGVREELERLNPKSETGNRKTKHHQWFTGEIGHPNLRSHIDGVIRLLKGADDWRSFKAFLNRFYPLLDKTDLGIEVEIKSKQDLADERKLLL